MNLDNADEVWSALTITEKQEFEALLKNGDIEKLLPQWIPWWTHHIKKKLVQDMDEQDNEQKTELPPLIDVPIFNELQVTYSLKLHVHRISYNFLNIISL